MARMGTRSSVRAIIPSAWQAGIYYYPGALRIEGEDWYRVRAGKGHLSAAGNRPGTEGGAEFWENVLDIIGVGSEAGAVAVWDGSKWVVGISLNPQVASIMAAQALLQQSALVTNEETDEQGEFDETGVFLSKPGAAPEDPPVTLHAQFDELAGLAASGATAADPPAKTSAVNLLVHSTAYSASDQFRAKTVAVAADRRIITVPNIAPCVVDGKTHSRATASLDIDSSANWDVAAGATAANRRGLDIYLYGGKAGTGNTLDLILSLNSTFPTGYTADNSRKLGCFHCLPVDVGTIASHDLTGYLMGDIGPSSVKCLLHRPDSVGFGEGMAELVRTSGQGAPGWWGDIYLLSGTEATSASAFNATIWDTKDWMTAVYDLSCVGKQLFSDWLFQIAALGLPRGSEHLRGARSCQDRHDRHTTHYRGNIDRIHVQSDRMDTCSIQTRIRNRN